LNHIRNANSLSSKARFDGYIQIMMKVWEANGEIEYANWFKSIYLGEGWDGWWCGASGVAGIGETNNFIESINKTIKLMVINQISVNLIFTFLNNLY
jgi:hypothetical protein